MPTTPPRKPLLRTKLGEALRRHRHEQDRTLAEVAGEARVSMPYLSEIERGQKEVSSEILAAVCDALRLDLADLLDEIGRELVRAEQTAQASVIRLDVIRASRSQRSSGPGDVMCLAA